MHIEVNVPDGESGNWRVSSFEILKEDVLLFNLRNPGRHVKAGEYKKLTHGNITVMSNTPAEINDHRTFIDMAKRGSHILINGLGLGVALTAILESDTIKEVIVIEKSADVIKLVAPHINDDRVQVIHADAFTWKSPRGMQFDAVWHDIWNDICSDNLPEMATLHRRYGKKSDWQGSWGKEECKRYGAR